MATQGSDVLGSRYVNIGTTNPQADVVLPAGKRLYRIVFTNTSTSLIFLQLHNDVAPLANGFIPMAGLIFRVPTNFTLVVDEATFGAGGELLGPNTHIALSSTFANFTAAAAADRLLCSLNYKVET